MCYSIRFRYFYDYPDRCAVELRDTKRSHRTIGKFLGERSLSDHGSPKIKNITDRGTALQCKMTYMLAFYRLAKREYKLSLLYLGTIDTA
jgi:hypothetical protein